MIDILPQDPPEDQSHPVLYRQESTFLLSEPGLELQADLWLQGSLPKRLVLELGPQLELTLAKIGERHLTWTPLPDQEDGRGRVTLELPADLPEVEQRVHLVAIAPLSIGALWTLPDMRPWACSARGDSNAAGVPVPRTGTAERPRRPAVPYRAAARKPRRRPHPA